jgi:hypothetical protein
MATRVSWGFAEITISFDMETPHGASDSGGTHLRARSTGVADGNCRCPPGRSIWEKPLMLPAHFPHPMRSSIRNLITEIPVPKSRNRSLHIPG